MKHLLTNQKQRFIFESGLQPNSKWRDPGTREKKKILFRFCDNPSFNNDIVNKKKKVTYL